MGDVNSRNLLVFFFLISGQPMATSTPAFQLGNTSSPVSHNSVDTERVISPAPGRTGNGLVAEDNFGMLNFFV